jgi:hypothetical protein
MATVTRTPKRPQDGTAAHLTASVTLAPTGPVPVQVEDPVSRPSRGGLSRRWHRVRMAVQEMNYAVRRLTELQAFPEQSYRQAQPSRPSRPSAH